MSVEVLIVDDDVAMGELLCGRLRRHGYSVTTRTSAVEAMLHLEQPKPTVVVTDVDMPGMSGLELCRRLRAENRTPVIVITAHATVDTAVEAMRAGAFDFITKPFDVETLVLAIERAIGQAQGDAGHGPVRVDAVVAAAVAGVTPLAERRGIAIVVEPAPVVAVLGHAHQLQRVFEHLLTNGAQAMDPGGLLRVRLDRSAAALHGGPSADTLSITVEDGGCGIPPAHLEQLFHNFFTTKRESGCAGLGLMVCHHIVRAHGGTIAVDSTPGQGSRFVVHLPVPLVLAGAEPAKPVHA